MFKFPKYYGKTIKTIETNEQMFIGKNDKPKSVLQDYKVYTNMIEFIEDPECIKMKLPAASRRGIRVKAIQISLQAAGN